MLASLPVIIYSMLFSLSKIIKYNKIYNTGEKIKKCRPSEIPLTIIDIGHDDHFTLSKGNPGNVIIFL